MIKPLSVVLGILLVSGCIAGPEDVTAKPAKSGEAQVVDSSGAAPQIVEEDPDRPPFEETSSGLSYRVLKEGTGGKPSAASTVTVHYRGWLENGQEFDSSYQRGAPATFPLGGVIAGWTEGLQLVEEGGKIELRIPSELGYGEAGMPPVIPPNAMLNFEVELISIQ